MLSEVPETRPPRKLIANQLLSREREQHLPTVGGREQPRNPVYGWSEVVAISLLCGARVQGHPHPKRLSLLPFEGEEPALGFQGGFQGIRGSGENGTEGVAHRLEDVATTLLYGAPQYLVVAGEGDLHDRGISLPHLSGTLYVGEQERDCACGRAGHYLDVLLASLKKTL